MVQPKKPQPLTAITARRLRLQTEKLTAHFKRLDEEPPSTDLQLQLENQLNTLLFKTEEELRLLKEEVDDFQAILTERDKAFVDNQTAQPQLADQDSLLSQPSDRNHDGRFGKRLPCPGKSQNPPEQTEAASE